MIDRASSKETMRKINKSKKSAMGQVVTIFITVLLVSVIAGMTFLFVGSLKDETIAVTLTGSTVTNETEVWVGNGTVLVVAEGTGLEFQNADVTDAWVLLDGLYQTQLNSTWIGLLDINNTGHLTNSSGLGNQTLYLNMSISYTFDSITDDDRAAYVGVNSTETAGMTVTDFLTILFLALIFSAILTVVLRIVLPFINVGNRLGGI